MSYLFNEKDKKSWRLRRNEKRKTLSIDVDEEVQKEAYPTKDDIVIQGRKTGSNIRIKDNGVIQMFAEDVGIKIDPNNKSIYLKGADKIGFEATDIHVNTLGNSKGFKWNYVPFNDELFNPYRDILTTVKGGSEMINKAIDVGLYSGYNSAGPVTFTPGPGMASFKAADIKNNRVYNNKVPPAIEKYHSITEGAKRIMNSIKEKWEDFYG
jgi:hypothetical protein